MSVLKPVVYLTVGGERFHWATTPGTPNARITDFSYEDTDGTGKDNKKKKGKRDELSFSFVDFDDANQIFLTDNSIFRIGSLVKFKFGFEGLKNLSKERIFRIVDVQNRFPEGIETATVVCHDLSKQMNTKVKDVTRPIKGRTKSEKTLYSLHEVIKECAEESGLRYKRDEPFFAEVQENGWQQEKETNIQFLSKLAKQYGAEVYVEGKDLHFTKKNRVVKRKIWGFLHRGQNAEFFNRQQRTSRVALMLSFSPKVNLEDTATSSESSDVSSEDGKKKQSSSDETETRTAAFDTDVGEKTGPFSKDGDQQSQKKKENKTPRNKKDGDLNNQASQQQGAESAVTANATVLGDVQLKAKITILTSGRISKRWIGHKWYVESCTHKIDSNGYFCDLSLTAPPDTGSGDTGKADKKKQDQKTENKFIGFSADTGNPDGTVITETTNKDGTKTTSSANIGAKIRGSGKNKVKG